MTPTDAPLVLRHDDDRGVATLTLNRPQAFNSLSEVIVGTAPHAASASGASTAMTTGATTAMAVPIDRPATEASSVRSGEIRLTGIVRSGAENGSGVPPSGRAAGQARRPWQALYFRPEPHGHGSFRPTSPKPVVPFRTALRTIW